jgi:hypothetical protein
VPFRVAPEHLDAHREHCQRERCPFYRAAPRRGEYCRHGTNFEKKKYKEKEHCSPARSRALGACNTPL